MMKIENSNSFHVLIKWFFSLTHALTNCSASRVLEEGILNYKLV